MPKDLTKFFTPKSVVVVGASNDRKKVGYDCINNLIQAKYPGKIYPVNPKAPNIQGIKAYKSLSKINKVIELVVIAVPARFVLSIIDEMGKLKLKNVIIITAGFKEIGAEGAKLEHQLGDKLKQYGIRAVGPNCLGLMDTHTPLNASFASKLPLKGNLGFISQSGALITGILDWSLNEGLGFSKFISVGNKLDIDEVDLIAEMGRDPNTQVILAYLEMISKGDEFIKICQEVVKEKPVIVIKSGTSKAGARAASSHTGSMAGANTAYDAAFEKAGVIRADSVEELFDSATAFSTQPLPRSPNLCIITNAGGPGIIATDHAEKVGLNLPSLSGDTINYLLENLPPAAATNNPVDVLGTGTEKEYRVAMETVLKDDHVDLVLVILTPQGMTEPVKTAHMIIEQHQLNPSKPVSVSYMGGADLEEGAKILKENGIPCFSFPERATTALAGLWKYSQIREKVKLKPAITTLGDIQKERVDDILESVLNKGRVQLLGSEAIEVAHAYGISAPKTKTAFTVNEASNYAKEIGFPVVMKITSPDIIHKTDIGGVVIGVETANEVKFRFKQMMRNARKHFPDTKVIGVDIQELKKRSMYELIIGVSKDPQWGHLCIIGGGGIYTNIYKDVSFNLVPVSNREAQIMLQKTKIYQILLGARGLAPAKIDAIIETLERISLLISDHPEILDLDINPLLAFKDGVSAVDVKITISPEKHYFEEEN